MTRTQLKLSNATKTRNRITKYSTIHSQVSSNVMITIPNMITIIHKRQPWSPWATKTVKSQSTTLMNLSKIFRILNILFHLISGKSRILSFCRMNKSWTSSVSTRIPIEHKANSSSRAWSLYRLSILLIWTLHLVDCVWIHRIKCCW